MPCSEREGPIAIIEGIAGRAHEIGYLAQRMENGRVIMPEEHGFGLKLRCQSHGGGPALASAILRYELESAPAGDTSRL